MTPSSIRAIKKHLGKLISFEKAINNLSPKKSSISTYAVSLFQNLIISILVPKWNTCEKGVKYLNEI